MMFSLPNQRSITQTNSKFDYFHPQIPPIKNPKSPNSNTINQNTTTKTMIKSLINRFKKTKSFKEFYTNWITTLKTTLLPPLTDSLAFPNTTHDPLLLSTHVQLLLSHFNTYFSALETASNSDVSQLLYPPWRTDLEKPFLWIGDFHPYIFTNLLRSFYKSDDNDEIKNGYESELRNFFHGSLGHNVEQLECGLRLMVPAIAKRVKDVQGRLVRKLAVGGEMGVAVNEVVEELICVFLDANRLRRSVVNDIVAALNVYEAAYFLHGLAEFYVGFRDDELIHQFNEALLIPAG